MKAVAGALDSPDVAHRFAPDKPFGHLVHQGLAITQADKTAELSGVDPIALGGGGAQFEQRGQLHLDLVQAVQHLVHLGLTGSG